MLLFQHLMFILLVIGLSFYYSNDLRSWKERLNANLNKILWLEAILTKPRTQGLLAGHKLLDIEGLWGGVWKLRIIIYEQPLTRAMIATIMYKLAVGFFSSPVLPLSPSPAASSSPDLSSSSESDKQERLRTVSWLL